jgi:hypothetical protein
MEFLDHLAPLDHLERKGLQVILERKESQDHVEIRAHLLLLPPAKRAVFTSPEKILSFNLCCPW